jgi:hypothetical protein
MLMVTMVCHRSTIVPQIFRLRARLWGNLMPDIVFICFSWMRATIVGPHND